MISIIHRFSKTLRAHNIVQGAAIAVAVLTVLQGVNNDPWALQLGGSLACVYTEAYGMYAHDQSLKS